MSSSTFISVEQSDLTWAAEQGLLSASEVAALWPALVNRAAGRGGINVALVSFYAGALLITGALTWFLNVVWASSTLLFFLSLAYVILFGAAGVKLWFDGPTQFGVPQLVGGLFVTVAVAVSPVVTFAVERYFNAVIPNHEALLIELTPVVTGALALSVVRFPFLTAPISAGLFLAATCDLPTFFIPDPSLNTRCLIAFVFGLGMNAVAFITDHQKLKQDYAFWLYLFGGLSSFISITTLFFTSHILGPYHVGYAIFSAIYLIVAGLINRQSLVVFGALGEAFYLLWLTNDLFADSWAYPFALTAVGLLIIYMGIQLQKYFNNSTAKAAEATEEVAPTSSSSSSFDKVSGLQYAPAHYMPLPIHAPHLSPMQPHFFMPAAVPVPVVPASKHDPQAERFV